MVCLSIWSEVPGFEVSRPTIVAGIELVASIALAR